MGSLKDFRKKEVPSYFSVPEDSSEIVTVLVDPVDFVYGVEHSSPENWRKTAQCTYDENEQCYGCEQAVYAWNQKIKVFIPVSHNGTYKIWSQGVGINSGLWPLLDNMPTAGKAFEITRSGAGKRTKYTAIPVDNELHKVYTGPVSKVNLTAQVAYDKQANYYN